ncbi:transmembrane emp24 domain-containing protein 6-like [Gigantopelta aegis]|uniref:transmembrane emp24 domain-containing protein 6-like n=1 Tax=Gigantopelta aegis TaxID=1735272 RepID=UPI001B88D8FA|nr:transmembrane emp24 domain-containing protein 6-like [Gigantopelta aegis]
MCIDNLRGQFGSKLVLLEILSFHDQDWENYMEHMEDYDDLRSELATSLGEVDQSISQMKRFQSHTRMNIVRDWYVIQSNNKYISYYSLVQCFVIVICSLSQVYMLRRFFRTVPVTPNSKPRA